MLNISKELADSKQSGSTVRPERESMFVRNESDCRRR